MSETKWHEHKDLEVPFITNSEGKRHLIEAHGVDPALFDKRLFLFDTLVVGHTTRHENMKKNNK
jgi:hypothetical protein